VSAARATADCRVRVPRKNRAVPVLSCAHVPAVSRLSAERRLHRFFYLHVLVVSVHVSRGDSVIRAASRSRLSAYRDFDFYDDDCLCAGSAGPCGGGAQPKE